MSWFTSVSNVPAADVKAAVEAVEVNIGEFGHDAMVEQVAAAKAAAIALFESGALGSDADATYHVNLSGHGNPDHAKTEGWANDAITVTVTRA